VNVNGSLNKNPSRFFGLLYLQPRFDITTGRRGMTWFSKQVAWKEGRRKKSEIEDVRFGFVHPAKHYLLT